MLLRGIKTGAWTEKNIWRINKCGRQTNGSKSKLKSYLNKSFVNNKTEFRLSFESMHNTSANNNCYNFASHSIIGLMMLQMMRKTYIKCNARKWQMSLEIDRWSVASNTMHACMHVCTNSRNERETNSAEKHKTPNYANESNEDGDR